MQMAEGIDAQVARVFDNLKAVAAAAGGSLADAVKVNIYLTDLAHFAKVNDAMAQPFQPALSGPRHGAGGGAAARRAGRNRRGARAGVSKRRFPEPRRPRRRNFAQLGIRTRRARDQDLVLHLPLRYEDETRVVAIADLRAGLPAQVEGSVVDAEVQYRPRRQLVARRARRHAAAAGAALLHFYPSQQKQLAPGRACAFSARSARRLPRREMVHPRCRVTARRAAAGRADAGVPDDRRPRRSLDAAAAASHGALAGPTRRDAARGAARALHLPGRSPTRPPAARSAAAVNARSALEERDAPGVATHQVRRTARAAALAAPHRTRRDAPAHRAAAAGERRAYEKALRRAAVQRSPARSSACWPRSSTTSRADPMQRLLQGDVGSGKTVVAALAALQADRERAPGRADGADRDPRRAALPQAPAVARRRWACEIAWLAGGSPREGARRDRSRRSPAAEPRSPSARTR
jgi:ATP-dependent DNA helicase RecG